MTERKAKRPAFAKNATVAVPAAETTDRGELVLYTAEDGGGQFYLRASHHAMGVPSSNRMRVTVPARRTVSQTA